MSLEIERKFLVKGTQWKQLGTGQLYKQGYFLGAEKAIVRVRIQSDKAFLGIKSSQVNLVRQEYEYEIPLEDANFMLSNLVNLPIIEKYRYRIPFAGFIWEVDEFIGSNAGLVVAEIELKSPNQVFDLPDFIGEEVTGQAKYYNANLSQNPYQAWPSAKTKS